MADLTARFGADFTKFSDAVAQATTELKDFETDSSKVQEKLNRLGDAYSGRNTIQQAELVTKAIAEIGGATTLTAKEQEKVNRVVTEAIAKYDALGKDAPEEMKRLAAETADAGTSTNLLTNTVTDLAASLAGLFTVRAAVNFVEGAIASASALQTLSAQTRINVEDLQVMTGALSEFGIDADTLGRAVFGLSQKIAGNDTSVSNALHAMGLTIDEVAGLNGEELFLKMEHGLATLQGNLRDTTAVDLFGEKLGRAMAGASTGIDGAMEKWRAMNNIISTDTVQALDDMGNAMNRAKTNIENLAINGLGPLAQGFNTLAGAAEGGASKFSILWAVLTDFVLTQQTGQKHTEALTALLDDQAKKAEATAAATRKTTEAHQAAPPALDAHGQAMRALAALEADAAKPLLDWQIQYLDKLRELDQLDAQHAKTAGVSAEQLKLYSAAVRDRAAAEKDAADAVVDAWKRQQKAIEDFDKAQAAVHALSIKHAGEVRAELEKLTAARLKDVNDAVVKELEAEGRLAAQWGETQPTALQKYLTAIEKLNAAHIEGIKDTAQRQEAENQFAKDLLDFAVNGEAATVTTVGLTAAEREHADALNAVKEKTDGAAEAVRGLTQAHIAMAPGVYEMESYFDQATAAIDRYHHALYMGDPNAAPPPIMMAGGPQLPAPGYGGSRPTGSGIFFPNPTGTGAGAVTHNTYYNITQPLGTPNQIARAVGAAQTSRAMAQGARAPEF